MDYSCYNAEIRRSFLLTLWSSRVHHIAAHIGMTYSLHVRTYFIYVFKIKMPFNVKCDPFSWTQEAHSDLLT